MCKGRQLSVKQKASNFNTLLKNVWKSTVGWILGNITGGLCVTGSLDQWWQNLGVWNYKDRKDSLAYTSAPPSFGTFIFYSLICKNPLYIRLLSSYYSCLIFVYYTLYMVCFFFIWDVLIFMQLNHVNSNVCYSGFWQEFHVEKEHSK